MMRQSIFTLERTRALTADTFELTLRGDASAVSAPGQFVNLQLPGKFLRRPISVCDWGPDALILLVKAVGAGTRELVRLPAGTGLDVLSGLGNGFQVEFMGDRPVLAGGGIGIAPLYGLAKRLMERGASPAVALGFRSEKDAFYLGEFAALGCAVEAAAEDGGLSWRGLVTDLIAARFPDRDYVCACGPTPMLRSVHALPQWRDGQFSFEARMACGFGACVGCTVFTANGPKRVCRDGPILYKEEILW